MSSSFLLPGNISITQVVETKSDMEERRRGQNLIAAFARHALCAVEHRRIGPFALHHHPIMPVWLGIFPVAQR